MHCVHISCNTCEPYFVIEMSPETETHKLPFGLISTRRCKQSVPYIFNMIDKGLTSV